MKKRWCAYLLGGCLAAGLLGCGESADAGAADLTESYRRGVKDNEIRESSEEFKKAYTEFAVALLSGGRSGREGKNTMVSPLSVMTALEMTRAGAAGDTLAQMDQTLYSGMIAAKGKEELMTFANRLPNTNKVRFHMADSVWFRDDAERFVPDENFLRTEAEEYDASVFSAAFDADTCDTINQWVSRETDGMVPEIVDQIPEDAVMYLVNAMAFQGEWEEVYRENQLGPAEFTCADGSTAEITMMYGEEQTYLENQDAVGFVKPYKDGYAFAALLPRGDLSLDEYLGTLDAETFLGLLAGASDEKVETGLPKFTAETGLELSELLSEMGMPLAFDVQNADFSVMGSCPNGENICISRVLHRTYIDVNETGTKAAAAAVVEMIAGYALSEEPKRVILDRPFVYAIIEEESGLPVFIGTVEAL